MVDTIDLSAFITNPDGSITQAMATASCNGQSISGTNKFAQRYIINLLTSKGSVPYLPLKGTNFITALQAGILATEQDVFVAFAASLSDLARQMASEESSTDPADETYNTSSLKTVTIQLGSVSLTINVLSNAGTSIVLTLPLVFNL